jgi:hypothetical protein
METHHTQHVSAEVPVDNPMSELRNRAVHANHLHGEGWEKKKERKKKPIFLYTFPLFLSLKICVSNFHKGNSDHYLKADEMCVQYNILYSLFSHSQTTSHRNSKQTNSKSERLSSSIIGNKR